MTALKPKSSEFTDLNVVVRQRVLVSKYSPRQFQRGYRRKI